MKMILYKTEKSATQSGLAKSEKWFLRPITEEKIYFQYQPTKWSGSHSTIKQTAMEFSTKEEAITFCKKHKIEFVEAKSYNKTIKPKSYTETILNS